jgi:hypothetical protein
MNDLTQNEREVLRVLFESSQPDGEMCLPFSYIEGDTKLNTKEVRKACRSLRMKGFAQFYRGLMTEDGEVAGSGYSITEAGCTLSERIEEIKQDHLRGDADDAKRP